MSRLVFDLETNGLLDTLTEIHSLVIYDLDTNTSISCCDNPEYDPVETGIEILQHADEIIGHNIIKFDIPAIKKLYPSFKYKGKVFDTLVAAKLVFPDISEKDFILRRRGNELPSKLIGSYSLAAFGYRLKCLKGEYGEQENAWDKWTEEMQKYCERDVLVTKKLYERIEQEGYSQKARDLEHEFAQIIFEQEQRGVCFDVEKAKELEQELRAKQTALTKELKKAFLPLKITEIFVPKVNNQTRGYVKGVPFEKVRYEEFNPSSRQQIGERLIRKYGWKPKEKTPSGLPKVDESVLNELDYPEAKLLSEYLLVSKLLGQLADGKNAWLKLVTPEGRIHGVVNTLGAVTRRCTHNRPNLAQVPSANSPYGEECRSLFIVPKGYKLVGCDASGLELRCLAHYMNDKNYTNEILNGDIHTKNQEAAGLPTRNNAKTFIYGFLYGAGAEKIGSIIGKGSKAGQEIKNKFLKSLPALASLIKGVKKKIELTKTLKSVDGSTLKVRESYRGLNTLLQSAGAIVMKKALCILYNDCKQEQLDVHFVLNIHDEYQAEVADEDVDRYCVLAVDAIRKAGDYYGFRCPLDGEAKVGMNWAETH